MPSLCYFTAAHQEKCIVINMDQVSNIQVLDDHTLRVRMMNKEDIEILSTLQDLQNLPHAVRQTDPRAGTEYNPAVGRVRPPHHQPKKPSLAERLQARRDAMYARMQNPTQAEQLIQRRKNGQPATVAEIVQALNRRCLAATAKDLAQLELWGTTTGPDNIPARPTIAELETWTKPRTQVDLKSALGLWNFLQRSARPIAPQLHGEYELPKLDNERPEEYLAAWLDPKISIILSSHYQHPERPDNYARVVFLDENKGSIASGAATDPKLLGTSRTAWMKTLEASPPMDYAALAERMKEQGFRLEQ